jgi:hypothetical protein
LGLALCVALALALAVAFVVAPRALAAQLSGGLVEQRELAGAFRAAFVEYWAGEGRRFPPALERVVDYWFHYHLVKAVIAASLLAVFAGFDVWLWRVFVAGRGLGPMARVAVVSASALVTMLAVLSLVTVMANVQGAVAPFASLLPMLAGGETGGDLADAVERIKGLLADTPGAGSRTPPTLEVMISDFSRYHVVMAAVSAVVAAALMGLTVACWKRYVMARSADRRTRWAASSFGVLSAALSLVMIVLAVANTTTAADPAPALLAFFEGAW